MYVVWIVIAAIVSAILTWAVWRAGNKQQDAVIAETNQRAAMLNERAAKLENDAAQARLELEKIKLTRFDRFNREEFRNRIRGKPKIRVELLFQQVMWIRICWQWP